MNDATLKLTSIKKELPDNIKEATLALFLANSQSDSATYASLVSDFIQKFPQAAEGYIQRAQLASNGEDYTAAEKDIETALKTADTKDEVHFAFARLIYNKEIFGNNKVFPNWNLDKALSEIQTAITINPLSTYRQLKANILFAQQKYDDEYSIYDDLSKTDMHNAETFYAAAKCKEMLKDTTAMMALLDSTMSTFTKPYLKEAAPYIWARAEARRNIGKYREAVSDMNDYEELMQASVNDNFYYVRHQTEIEGRLYQQALNDINRAIRINPQETLYYAEKASLQIRVNLFADAVETAQELITIDPNESDGYMFLGLAQCLTGNKKEGIPNLQKAKDMGNTQAEGLIQKYQ